jgi:NADH-quinone oxidoreductase subunit E
MSTEAAMLKPEIIQEIKETMARYPKPKSAILMALHRVQEELGWVPPEAQAEVAEIFDMPPADVQSIVTFYYMYHRQPVGRYVVKVCRSISCYLRGSTELIDHLEKKLEVKLGETTKDGTFTLIGGECLAACTGAPCLQVNDRFFENADSANVDALLERLRKGDKQFPPAVLSIAAPAGNEQGVKNAESI